MNQKITSCIAKISAVLEFFVAAVLLAAILVGALLWAAELGVALLDDPRLLNLNQALDGALSLVVGIEFVKMLVKHAPEAVVEVLLFAIAREMVAVHSGSFETLMGVIAVGIIFLIRKYLCLNGYGPPKNNEN